MGPSAAFFERQGVNAWCGGGVPSYITTNPYIARAYARVVAAFLWDCRPVDPTQPVYIVELGAGSGCFAFHFLKALETILGRSAVDVPYTYVMTDFTEQNLSSWRAHHRSRHSSTRTSSTSPASTPPPPRPSLSSGAE